MARAQKRDRGRILTDAGYKRIWTAIYEVFPDRQTYASIATWTDPLGDNPNAKTYMTAETISKILNQRQGVELKTLYALFHAFGLTLQDSDHILFNEKSQPKSDPNFVGREEAFSDLDSLIHQGAKVIVIKAAGGVGKTTLAQRYLQQKFGSFIEFRIAKETKDIAPVEALVEQKLRELGEEPGRELMVSLDRLKYKLQSKSFGILIDNLEPALNVRGEFIDEHRSYVELLRVLIDPTVRSITLITSREKLQEPSISVFQYLLKGLSLSSWSKFFQAQNIANDPDSCVYLHESYGGNAKAMEIISGAILEDQLGNVSNYWELVKGNLLSESGLESLVLNQFNRIQKLDNDAYNLLLRLGCYRYQDISSVPKEGLFCLLWDVNPRKHLRLIKSLIDRSLINTKDKECEYFLHPVVRSEALERLKKSPDWMDSNIHAAEYWSSKSLNVENIEQARFAIEAFYHYLEIPSFDLACEVILADRQNSISNRESLGNAFQRLGLLTEMISAINQIKNNIEDGFPKARLYNILGDLLWMSGKIKSSIDCHQVSNLIACEALKNIEDDHPEYRYLTSLKIVSFFNIGLCNLDLGEHHDARSSFEHVLFLSNQDKVSSLGLRFGKSAKILLFYIDSLMNPQEICLERLTQELVNLIYKDIEESADGSTWYKGNIPIFLAKTYYNIGYLDEALMLLNKAIEFSEKSSYFQVKGKALVTISEVRRSNKKFDESLDLNLKGIEILEEIGAICDAAEAHYTLGTTYRLIGRLEESIQSLEKALEKFNKVGAIKRADNVKLQIESILGN